ncbi:MAG: hypothetical protein D6784_01365 [Chloroflexi bacterium]|nr:MAG: hypothetical protein D6784_01365 [Chloroflexota bacterium]
MPAHLAEEINSPLPPENSLDWWSDALLVYRWGSLLLAVGAYFFVPALSSAEAAWLLGIPAVSLLITARHREWLSLLQRVPLLLAGEIGLAVILLWTTGDGVSPYFFYALTPLFTAPFIRAGRWSGLLFAGLYGGLVWFAGRSGLPPRWPLVAGQIGTAWLLLFLVGKLAAGLQHFQQSAGQLHTAWQNVSRQYRILTTDYNQLNAIHEMTLVLQGLSNPQTVQEKLLKTVVDDLHFRRAVLGLVNPGQTEIDRWRQYPAAERQPSGASFSLSLTAQSSPLARILETRHTQWTETGQLLPEEHPLQNWLGAGQWLVLPLVHAGELLGCLLVEAEHHTSASAGEWVALTALVSQGAAALSAINRTRRLAVEQERNRIARDIHDTVAQSLFGLVFSLDACVKLLPHQAETVKKELLEIRNLAEYTRREVRQSILDIWPSELNRQKFMADLQKYVDSVAQGHGFNVEFSIDTRFDTLPSLIRRSLYRICQEALSNAARYAQTDLARVYLYIEPHKVSLSIRDKGCGFDPRLVLSRHQDRERFGLRGIIERVETLRGECQILSQPGRGTQIVVEIPLEPDRREKK